MESKEKRELTNELKELRKVVAELKKAKEDKKRIQAQLLQAQKMEAIGRLAGGMAHDFNNLLTAIIGYGHLLYDEIASDDPKREMLEEILNAASQAAGLTGQLLAFSRKKPVKLEVLNLNAIMTDVESMIDRLIGEDIDFSSNLEKGWTNVKGDATQIEQVILNLIVNARDAMPEGGKLTLRTEGVVISEKDARKMPYSRGGDFICLSVMDTGVGMDKKTISKIFDPFYTTKKTGTGLGLSVIHGIIKRHKGWISVESLPRKGTTFRIYLPVCYEAKTVKRKGIIPVSDLQGKGELILVIEDEDVTRKFIIKVLKGNGYSALEATSIEEASDIIKQKEDEIQMFFSDVVLSDGNGLNFAEELLAKNTDLKVLLSSGYIDEKSELSRIAEKDFKFLEKPYNVQELLSKIKETLA
jgi:two-component system cell cycle sensor histidine kinase/response regulator CckA